MQVDKQNLKKLAGEVPEIFRLFERTTATSIIYERLATQRVVSAQARQHARRSIEARLRWLHDDYMAMEIPTSRLAKEFTDIILDIYGDKNFGFWESAAVVVGTAVLTYILIMMYVSNIS